MTCCNTNKHRRRNDAKYTRQMLMMSWLGWEGNVGKDARSKKKEDISG